MFPATRFGFGEIALTVSCGIGRVRGAINEDHLQRGIDVPDDKSSREEIIGSLGRHVDFRGGAVIIFAPNLDGEGRCPVNEPHGIVGEGPK